MQVIFNKFFFSDPLSTISCHRLSQLKTCFEEMERALKKGFYLAGFLSYEAGYAFEKCFHENRTYDFPLVYFGVYHQPTLPLPLSLWERGDKIKLLVKKNWGEGYSQALSQIKAHLLAGNTYQINYTFKLKFNFTGSPFALYQKLRTRQSTSFSAFIKTDCFSILSLSPELFFRKEKNKIQVKPMKGTIAPGRNSQKKLKSDPKNQSENVMIVDLLRNDLGRIAKVGTVKVPQLFSVEKHPTLYQMTSSVTAEIPPHIPLYDLFRNLFPSGSVTGAPKIRSMQIIRELEKEDRKIYCGAIGYITPQRDMLFNVAIRTILLVSYPLPPGSYDGELGIGSGIIFDSNPEEEYQECLLKAKFLDF